MLFLGNERLRKPRQVYTPEEQQNRQSEPSGDLMHFLVSLTSVRHLLAPSGTVTARIPQPAARVDRQVAPAC